MYYKTRLKFNIMVFVVRPRPSNKRFRSTKIDFFDSGKKLRTDPGLEEPKLARNQKIKNRISVGNIRQNATFRHGFGRCLRRFCLIFSTDIENFIFLSWPDPGRPPTGRFRENCASRKTLQLSTKMRNISVSAAPETSNYATSLVFCRLFRFSTFVSKLLCGELANSAIILG